MKHAITVLGCVILALAWLTAFVEKVLDEIWPIMALALALVLLAAAIALSIWFIGSALARVHLSEPLLLPPARQTILHQSATSAPAPRLKEDQAPLDNSQGFKQQLYKFAAIGNSRGFSLRSMVGHVTRQAWELYIGLLVEGGVLSTGKAGTAWAQGWNLRLFLNALRDGRLVLPYPNGRAPVVHWIKPGSTAQMHSTTQATQPAQALYRD